MKTATLTIDPEFRSQIPPLRPEEREQLEANLVADGCRDPLAIWKDHAIILDGHNRHDICMARSIAFDTTEIALADREAALDWIDANQLGRRNLNPDQYSLLRGRRYNRAKKQHGGERHPSPQNEDLPKTAEKLARQHGVSKATIERDGQFAAAVEKVKAVDPEIEAKVVQGKAPPKGAIVEASKQLAKGESAVKAEASTPLLGSRRDQEAAKVWEKAKDQAEAILNGKLGGTVAQAKREIQKQEKRATLEAKAKEAEKSAPKVSPWEIITGDCVETLKQQEAGTVRLIFADPPYNIGFDYGEGPKADRLSEDDYLAWCGRWIGAAVDRLASDGSLWLLINHEWAAPIEVMLRRGAGLAMRAWLTWYETFGVNCANNFNRCSRRLLYAVKDPRRFVFNAETVTRPSDRQAKYGDKRADPSGKLWDDVWGINPPIPRLVGTAKERIPDFPTQLPVALLTAIVGCASEPGDLVLDPFSGSGTTGEAAIRLGRRYVGIEKSKRFAELARMRLKAVTGELNGK